LFDSNPIFAERQTSHMALALSTSLRTSFADAVERTRQALAQHGFGVLTEIDMKATLKAELGEDMEDYVILGACNPPLAHRAVTVDRQIGLLLPCNVVVRTDPADPGTVRIDAMNPQLMVQIADHEGLEEVADDATAALQAAIDSLSADPGSAERQAEMFERAAWEERYSGERIWSGRVNPQLEAEVSSLSPGRALDVGCGEGADTVWLAGRGWSVTALDFAVAALEKTAMHAAEAGVGDRITTRAVDIRDWQPGQERWDLISSQFMHLPAGGMVQLTRRLGSAVAPGGTLLIVGHHPDDMTTGLRHGDRSALFTPEDLASALEDREWEIEVCETRARVVSHPDSGEEVSVQDSVLRARRLV
jgi:uncharacterized protein (DUF302 family)/SAM-dependent methyltransferase